jgi:hypothetical protein
MKKQNGLLVNGEAAYVAPAMEMIELDTETSFADGSGIGGAAGPTDTTSNTGWSGSSSDIKSIADMLDSF